ncbi:LOW QUALITY PROTEIN: zinc finger CCCH domain-containing protein 15 homolog [Rhopalosiphum padi]|uniref:LOW QUALITY PROTEIN: zinc finger CCCH domain-containing protein 15 homolog n=1 Tax=Rhopalosiphum padi TaxID=40932 RepID=UPI00298D73B1|nr:LOW QUALITY PROTEIN: zinc finger CCCH domain-containing protein 15 homolog [Rhopalosiphum padi]
MPPKTKAQGTSKKADAKKKERVIEDKTFGLKNKKGAKQQRFIQQVEKQVKSGGIAARKVDDKKKDDKTKDDLGLIFKPVQKVEKGADPKSILCAFFKQGQCAKGSKCKFSHDLATEKKAEKRSMYVDLRDGEENDTMENWDEDKLKEVVDKKHGENDKKHPTTDIICMFFLEAVEKSKYGWFWSCPNGTSCIYRHALPPGFVLKKDKKKDDKKDEIQLEDLIERERAALNSVKFTRVTLESFLAWKKRKVREKKDAIIKDEEKKRTDYKAGRQIGLSGREMFSFNPEMAIGDSMDDGEEAFDAYIRDEDEELDGNVKVREIQLETLELEASEVDDTGTPVTQDRFNDSDVATIPINENLFVDEDFDDLDDELDELNLDDNSTN